MAEAVAGQEQHAVGAVGGRTRFFAHVQAEERIVRQARAGFEQADVASCGQALGQRIECASGQAGGLGQYGQGKAALEGGFQQGLQIGTGHARVIGRQWRD